MSLEPISAQLLALNVYKNGGIRALYAGLGINILANAVSWGLYFFGYELYNEIQLLTPQI